MSHILEKLHYLTPHVAVERSRGLIGQKQAGFVRQGSGYSYTLLLPTGKLTGQKVFSGT